MTRAESIDRTIQNFQRVFKEFPQFRYAGDPILRQETQEATLAEGVEIGRNLGDVLVHYRKLVGYGRGLAAPQIGISKSVFVTFLDDEVQGYINPGITASSDTYNYYRELCLSSGIIWGDVRRPERITMKWTDFKGNLITKEVDGFLARLWQHEERHLHGELNIDVAQPGSLEIVTDDPLKEVLRDRPLFS
ncbi:MAG: peptide deformylase [Patescibacteria group bacterium]|nr:peptide deformylase [Patescibacteria group bacterium]MCL5432086.1 peptide deformylase [Patescibacteria group bacterium]